VAGRRENAAFYLAWAHEHQQRFLEHFWDAAHGCLYTELRDGEPRIGLTPSQLWAVSLAPMLLPLEQARTLVERADELLATPFGLREAPGGEVAHVEWLAPFLTAHLKVNERAPAAMARARERLTAIADWLCEEGLGLVPGTFAVSEDTATPPAEHGLASPVAAAALLRAWIEDLEHVAEPETATVARGAGETKRG